MDRFAKSKLMTFPREVLVGHGVLDDVAWLLGELNLSGPALVVTGERTRALAGERAAAILSKGGIPAELIVTASATQASVERALAAARAHKAGVILGVGGGSVIDVAKLTAFRHGAPYVSVPTSASHDGLTSPRASIKEEAGSASKEAKAPLAIVADTGVIVQAPYRTLAAGCADAISNATAVLDWKLAHRLRGEEYSSFAAVLAETSANMIMENVESIKPNLEEAVWLVVKSLIVSGVSMSVAGSSRPASGSEHMFSHTLDLLAPGRALHGEQVGVGSIMMMYLHGGDWRRIRDALAKVGAPTTAAELNVDRKTIIDALVRAHENKPDRYTILGDKGLSRDAAEDLVRATGVA
ncbi:MAG TPA: NAD(P)-dependent glycerol-1-phosphate dehydrogenase [Candidatus Thermoplasmatota archaeon]|nr:NAD(P)-dependent glycerol-1-phosphate dehydrogenase [Candidatus Thermoplasmatota archaeon]